MLTVTDYDYNINYRKLNNDRNVFHNALKYVLMGEKRFHVEGEGYDYDLVYEDNDVRAKKDPAFPDSDFFLSEMLYPPYYFYDENDLSKINMYLLEGFDEIFFEETSARDLFFCMFSTNITLILKIRRDTAPSICSIHCLSCNGLPVNR